MKLSLMVLNAGKASGQTIAITTPQFVIGRDAKCNLRPASAMISKQHCALIIKDEKVYLKDFDSTNGTFVNDQPIKGAVQIKHGDMLKVGPLTFKVVLEGVPAPVAAAKPTPTPPPKPKFAVADDDPAAALLLSCDEENSNGEALVGTTEDVDSVPGGSTIMELPAVAGKQAETADTPAPDAPKPPHKPAEKKPNPSGAAQSAAQAILDRYKKGLRKS
jgi:pSer/pThr/pTyr-binding forkhead associated (FHA) protein